MKLNKIIENLFYFFIFLLPIQTSYIVRESFIGGGKWQYGTILFYLTDLLLIFLFILSILSFRKNLSFSLKRKRSPLIAIIFWFILFSFASVFWSPDKELALYSFIKLISAIAIFFIVINIKINWKKVFLVLLFSALIQSSLGLYQFLNQDTFNNSYLGLSEYSPGELGVSVIETPGRRWLRAYGGFTHPNILGGYLAITLLMSLYFYSKRKIHSFKDLLLNILILISLNILFAGLIVSFSRSAWLIFILSFISFFIFSLLKKKKLITLNLIKILSLFLMISFLFYSLAPYLFKTRLGLISRLETKSIEERIDYTTQAKSLIKDNLFFGTGIGNYTLANHEKLNNNQPAWYYQPVHNVYLLILAELGLVGLILFLFIAVYPFFIFIKKKFFNLKNIILFLSFLSLFIIMLFDHYLWTSHFGLLFFWLILGLFVKTINSIDKNNA
jgi:O-antigen ligase